MDDKVRQIVVHPALWDSVVETLRQRYPGLEVKMMLPASETDVESWGMFVK